MPYDANLDVGSFSRFWQNDTGKIVVSVPSYNNGPINLQITRELEDKQGNPPFAKLGRLSREEVEGILPIIEEALKSM